MKPTYGGSQTYLVLRDGFCTISGSGGPGDPFSNDPSVPETFFPPDKKNPNPYQRLPEIENRNRPEPKPKKKLDSVSQTTNLVADLAKARSIQAKQDWKEFFESALHTMLDSDYSVEKAVAVVAVASAIADAALTEYEERFPGVDD